jgi:hypothetical protein
MAPDSNYCILTPQERCEKIVNALAGKSGVAQGLS